MEYIVYKITNKLNGKVYIGQTTEGIEKRWKRHCGYQLNDGTYIHNAIKKYGKENFIIEQIDEAKNQNELNILEAYYINLFKDNSYNLKFDDCKCGGDTLSYNSNIEEIKKKISDSKKYDKNPNSTKIKMIDILNNTEQIFNSLKECQDKYDIPRHDIISRRCRGIIKKPYKNRYLFEYSLEGVSTIPDECKGVG